MVKCCQVKTFAKKVSTEEILHDNYLWEDTNITLLSVQVLFMEMEEKFQGFGTRMPINSYGSGGCSPTTFHQFVSCFQSWWMMSQYKEYLGLLEICGPDPCLQWQTDGDALS